MVASNGDDVPSVPGTPAQTRRTYDRLSRAYALAIEDLEFPPTAVAIRALELSPGDRAVDLGCGAGRAVTELAETVGPTGQVLGVDFAPGMCQETRRAIEQKAMEDRAGVVRGDVTDLPIRSESVDGAVTSFVLDLLSPADIETALSEADRVLVPAGRLATVSLAPSTTMTTRTYGLLRRIFPSALDCRPIPIEELLAAAGFDVEWTLTYSLHGLPVTVSSARPK